MKVHSKLRTLFLMRKNIVFFFACFCFLTFYDKLVTGVNETIIAFFIFFAISIFFQVINLHSVNELIISEEGITKINFISNKANFIPYTSIVNVQTRRIQGMYGEGGQITTGYFESILFLENGKKILISPDYFENYQEIIAKIRYHVLD
jgi:hypothetical protein